MTIRHHAIRILIAVLVCFSTILPTTSAAQIPVDTTGLTANTPDGVEIRPLAAAAFPVERNWDHLRLLLTRVPVHPGQSLNMRGTEQFPDELEGPATSFASHDHLLLVELGEIVLSFEDGEKILRSGNQSVFTDDVPYSLRNDSPECASVLRLSVGMIGGLGGPWTPPPNRNIPVSCGEPTVLSYIIDPPPSVDSLILFMAQITLEEGVFDIRGTHPGPTGLAVESGTLTVREEAGRTMLARLSPGSSIAIPSYGQYFITNNGPGPATLIIAGAIPRGQSLWLPSQYLGRVYPYRFAFTGDWLIDGESRGNLGSPNKGSFETLLLTHRESELQFSLEAYAGSLYDDALPFDSDPKLCVRGEVDTLIASPGVSDVSAMEGMTQALGQDNDATRTSALFSYTYTDATGVAMDSVTYVECRKAAQRGQTVMIRIVSHFGRNELDTSLDVIQSLHEGLVIPSESD